MKSATYYNPDGSGVVLDILATHEDGTVDLGKKKGEEVVTKCPLSEEAKPGFAVADSEPEKKTK